MTRDLTQSFTVNEDEKVAIDVLAAGERVKPAAFAREIFCRGLDLYLRDRKLHNKTPDSDLFEQVEQFIQGNEQLQKLKGAIQLRRELEQSSAPRRPRAARNMDDEAGESAGAKKLEPRAKRQ